MEKEKIERITRLVKDFMINAGAMDVGIATTETLSGGPPSTDLTYVLPEAKSAICFAVPMDQSHIERYLNKEDCRSHNIDNRRTNSLASGMAFELATFLTMKGRPSAAVCSNNHYRSEVPGGDGLNGATVRLVNLDDGITCDSCDPGNQLVTQNGVARFNLSGVPTSPTDIRVEVSGAAGYLETLRASDDPTVRNA